MARRNSSKNKTQKEPTIPWYKKVWFVISATTIIVSTAIINGPSLLENARIIPGEYSKTSSQFKSWLYEDSKWTGNWSANPEMYADVEDMNLSDVDMKITLWSNEGLINGTIATREICKSIPIFNYILLLGEVDLTGNKARVVAFDIFQGHKVDFSELSLEREGGVMTVAPGKGITTEWFPKKARLAWDDSTDLDHTYCESERKQFYDQLKAQPLNKE